MADANASTASRPAPSLPARVPAGTRWLAAGALVLLLLVSAGFQLSRIRQCLAEPRGQQALVADDARHYREIAAGFNAGDWRMTYVRQRPHRQPLYPLLLAVPLKWAPPDPFWLALVNVAVFAVLLLTVYLLVTALLDSPLAGLGAAALLAADRFLFVIVTGRLLTEPLFVLGSFLATAAFLAYARERRLPQLLLAGIAAGLSYLTRPNGLILAATLGTVLASADLWDWWRPRRAAAPPGQASGRRAPALVRLAGRYALFAAVFLAVTTPSWLPRLVYCQAPFTHGYLTNFMWTDSYAVAHTDRALPHAARDYWATHRLSDMLGRLGGGLKAVYLETPVQTELGRSNVVLFALAAVGLLLGLATCARPTWLLAAFMFLQLLPVAWSTLANPTLRIPYAALLPFALFFAADAVHRAVAAGAHWLAQRRRRDQAAPAAS